MSKTTKTARHTPDVLHNSADTPDPRIAGGSSRHPSTGVNAAAGDTETALLAGAP